MTKEKEQLGNVDASLPKSGGQEFPGWAGSYVQKTWDADSKTLTRVSSYPLETDLQFIDMEKLDTAELSVIGSDTENPFLTEEVKIKAGSEERARAEASRHDLSVTGGVVDMEVVVGGKSIEEVTKIVTLSVPEDRNIDYYVRTEGNVTIRNTKGSLDVETSGDVIVNNTDAEDNKIVGKNVKMRDITLRGESKIKGTEISLVVRNDVRIGAQGRAIVAGDGFIVDEEIMDVGSIEGYFGNDPEIEDAVTLEADKITFAKRGARLTK